MTKTCFVEFDPMNVSQKHVYQFFYSFDISKYIMRTNYSKLSIAARKAASMFNKRYWIIHRGFCYIRRSKQKSNSGIYRDKERKNIFCTRLDPFTTFLPSWFRWLGHSAIYKSYTFSDKSLENYRN
jgi:hypothetical protein